MCVALSSESENEMPRKIPQSFMLLGRSIRVTLIKPCDWKMPDAIGCYDSHLGQISILKTNPDLEEHTFFHELMHAVLTAMGRDKLNQDEAFVDMSSGLLMQAFTSARHKTP